MRPSHPLAAILLAFGLFGIMTPVVSGSATAESGQRQTPDLVMIALAFGQSLKLLDHHQLSKMPIAGYAQTGNDSGVFVCAQIFETSLFSLGLSCRRVRQHAAR